MQDRGSISRGRCGRSERVKRRDEEETRRKAFEIERDELIYVTTWGRALRRRDCSLARYDLGDINSRFRRSTPRGRTRRALHTLEYLSRSSFTI